MKIAVIGSGISGLSCAYRLSQAGYDVTLFEANGYFGGHTHTVDVTLEGISHGVDTGFLVFNHRTYPELVRLFEELQVETVSTDMSFSVRLPHDGQMLEWAGANLDTVFAQRRNLFDPRFIGMLRDILRFNRHATALAQDDLVAAPISLGEFLSRHRYGAAFRDWYLLPMAGCIWSCPTEQMLAFPLTSFVRFCNNHGLLQVSDRPQWHTVKGGARQYVEKLLPAISTKRLGMPVESVSRVTRNGIQQICIESAGQATLYDQAVLACHSDQALRILKDADPTERRLLGAIQYQPNRAVLHTDSSVLPQSWKAWSAWNYQRGNAGDPRVCVHYLINKLQPLPFRQPVIVSLNPLDEPSPEMILGEYDYAHPVFDAAAIDAQTQLATMQGRRNTWFAGAWTGYGFHEDGLKSGLAAAEGIMQGMPLPLPIRAAA